MRRKAVIAVLIILCFILQCTVFQALALAGISPNLLLIVTTSLGFMRGEKEGMAVGFFCGLLTDIFFWKPVRVLCPSVYVSWIWKRPVSHDVL